YNKADLTEEGLRGLAVARSRGDHSSEHRETAKLRDRETKGRASVSALTGRNIDRLIDIIRDRELENGEVLHLEIPHNDARVIARLHDIAVVYEQRVTDGAMLITAWI